MYLGIAIRSKIMASKDWTILDTSPIAYPPIKDEVAMIINSYGKKSALVINFNKHLFYIFELISHEAFHTYYQEGNGLPAWQRYIDQNTLSQACYHSVKDSYKPEAELLIQSYDLIVSGHMGAAKIVLKLYLDARKARYQKLGNIKIEMSGVEYSCEEAETHMEFLEGHAQYFGERDAISLGLIGKYTIASNYRYDLYHLSEGWVLPFYNFGSMQLHIIRSLNPIDFNHWTSELYDNNNNFEESKLYRKIEELI
jgi:hypothetical protein